MAENKLLEFRHISKSFPGVKALDDINVDLYGGEVHILVGENGAGKPSGITLGEVDESNLVIADLHGNLVEGHAKPTKETILHGGLYRRLPQIGAVVHVHPVYTIMCANCFGELPLVTKQMKQITSQPVPVLKIKHNTVDAAGMEMIGALLDCQPDACCFLLEEHGLVSFAKTMQDAQNNAELIEENARVYWEMAHAGR